MIATTYSCTTAIFNLQHVYTTHVGLFSLQVLPPNRSRNFITISKRDTTTFLCGDDHHWMNKPVHAAAPRMHAKSTHNVECS